MIIVNLLLLNNKNKKLKKNIKCAKIVSSKKCHMDFRRTHNEEYYKSLLIATLIVLL